MYSDCASLVLLPNTTSAVLSVTVDLTNVLSELSATLDVGCHDVPSPTHWMRTAPSGNVNFLEGHVGVGVGEPLADSLLTEVDCEDVESVAVGDDEVLAVGDELDVVGGAVVGGGGGGGVVLVCAGAGDIELGLGEVLSGSPLLAAEAAAADDDCWATASSTPLLVSTDGWLPATS